MSICLYLQVYRTEDGLGSKLDSEERKGLKVSVKVFISSLKKEALVDALNSGKDLSPQMHSFVIRYDLEPVLSNLYPTTYLSIVHFNTVLTYSMALVRKRTIPTKRPPLVSEVSANFCG
jgi:hypothetical protein